MKILDIGVPSEFWKSIEVISSKFQKMAGKVKSESNVKKNNNLPLYVYVEYENYINYKNSEFVINGIKFAIKHANDNCETIFY